MARWICVEQLPAREAARPDVVRLLARAGVAPMLAALDGGDDGAVVAAARAHADASGLRPCLWPLLSEADGYWPSEANVERLGPRVEALLEAARRAGLTGPLAPTLAIDLEPAHAQVVGTRRGSVAATAWALARAGRRNLDRARYALALRRLATLRAGWSARGVETLAIAYPLVAGDFGGRGAALQDLCEAPLDGVGWDRVAVMTYGSMIAGWSGGLLSVEDARWYGYRAVAAVRARFGRGAAAFVGVTGPGRLGDEPRYEAPEELERDVAAARAAGAGAIGAYALEGILGRADPERWLAALAASARRPPRRARGELVHLGLIALSRLLSRRGRAGEPEAACPASG